MSLLNGSLTMAGAINHATATGATNTYAIALTPPLPVGGYLPGLCILFIANAANTGACTVNVDLRGAKTIKKRVAGVSTDLAANDIGAGQLIFAMYDGTFFQVPSIGAAGGTGNVTVSGSPSSGQAAEWTGVSAIQGVAVTGTGSYMKATSPTPVLPIHVAPIVQPSTPGSGLAELYVDSTSKNLAVISDAGVVNHGVRTQAGEANSFVTAISDAGAVTVVQPAFTNISGALLTAQITDANVTLAKLVSIATASLLGRNTAGTGVPEVLSAATAKTLLALDQVSNTSNTQERAATAVLTNKAITPRVLPLTDAATVTLVWDTTDVGTLATLSQPTNFANPTGTGSPADEQTIEYRVKSTAVRAVTFGSEFRGSTDLPLPVFTIGASLTERWKFKRHLADTTWDFVSYLRGF